MNTSVPIRQATPFFNKPVDPANQTREAEPKKDPQLVEAEEEEMMDLWAADPGNQGG